MSCMLPSDGGMSGITGGGYLWSGSGGRNIGSGKES